MRLRGHQSEPGLRPTGDLGPRELGSQANCHRSFFRRWIFMLIDILGFQPRAGVIEREEILVGVTLSIFYVSVSLQMPLSLTPRLGF